MVSKRIWVDTLILKLHLVAKIFGIHSFLLGAVGGGFTLALTTLLEADERKDENEDKTDSTCDGPNGDFRGFWEGVKFLGDGLLLLLGSGCEG